MMRIKFDSIWIDMDNTLMDWSKGNMRKALIDIEDPEYYRYLEPTSEGLYDVLKELKRYNIGLHVISGIPDFVHCYYVPIISYLDYYDKVCKAKDYTIDKYFPDIFDSVDYLIQSKSKSQYILENYQLGTPVFLDDYSGYINQWKEDINPYAFKVDKIYTCQYYLEELLSQVERG